VKPRFLFSLVFAVLTVVAAGLVVPGASSGQGSPYNSVTGAVQVTFPNFPALGLSTTEQLVVSAHDGPNGPTGSIVFRSPLSAVPVATADVTCLVVIGSDAWVGGTFTEPFVYGGQSGFPASTLTHIGVQLRDNGSPGNGVPDAVHPVVFPDRPRPPTFSPCNLDQPLFPVDQGNLVVYEAATG
jgi:hypothetical protein